MVRAVGLCQRGDEDVRGCAVRPLVLVKEARADGYGDLRSIAREGDGGAV